MGNQLAASGAASNFDIHHISNSLQLVAPLGGRKRGRLFTSLHCQNRGERRDVVVKVFVRNSDDKKQAEIVAKYGEEIVAIERAMRAFHKANPQLPCNVLFYAMASRTQQYCMLQRPFVHYSLPERLQTRPFFTESQRLFTCYQLLCAVRQLHEDFKCVHGDLKAENVLVTTTGWVYVTDLCPYKPATLPSYNPANFEYFYDNSETSLCCLDPSKFLDEAEEAVAGKKVHTPQMDVFSAMCIIVQTLTDEPLFKLRDVLTFRSLSHEEKKAFLHDALKERTLSESVLKMVTTVLCAPPSERPSAFEIIKTYTGSVFPPFFSMLYRNIVPALLPMPPDIRIQSIWTRFDEIMDGVVRCLHDEEFAELMPMGERPPEPAPSHSASPAEVSLEDATASPTPQQSDVVSHSLSLEVIAAAKRATAAVIAPLVTTGVRQLKTVDSKTKAIHLIRRLQDISDASVKRDVLLPSILHVLREPSQRSPALVRVAALRALVAVATGLSECEMRASECLMYEDLIMPTLAHVSADRRALVQVEFVQSAPKLVKLALKYLQQRQVFINGATYLNTYDYQLSNIVDRGWEMIKPFFGSDNSSVVSAALHSVELLVEVLGAERAMDDLVPMLMTLLGYPAIEVRRLLLRQIKNVVSFMKPDIAMVYATEGLSSSDSECIAIALETIQDMVANSSLPDRHLLDLVQRSIPHLSYPDKWVSKATAKLLEEAAKHFEPVDILAKLEAPLRSMFIAEIPLSKLSKCEGFIKPEAALYTQNPGATHSRQKSSICTDYSARVGYKNDTVTIATNHVRHSGDIPCDTQYVDVGDLQDSATPKKDIWSMKQFHPLPRQRKRLQKRTLMHSAVNALGREASLSRTGSSLQQRRTTVANNRVSNNSRGPSMSPAASPQASPHGSPSRDFASASPPSAGQKFLVDDGSAKQKRMRPIAAPLAINTMHEGPIYGMGFNNGWMATGGHSNTVRLWDVEETITSTTGILRPTTVFKNVLPTPNATVLFSEFVHQDLTASLVAVGGTDGVFTVMDAEAGTSLTSLNLDGGNAGGLSSCVPLGRQPVVLIGSHRGGVYAVDLRASKEVWSTKLPRAQGPINSMLALRPALASSGVDPYALVCGTLRGTVALFDLRFRTHLESFHVGENRTNPIHAMCRGGGFPVQTASPPQTAQQAAANASVAAQVAASAPATPPSSICVSTDRGEIIQMDLNGKKEVLTMVPREHSKTTALFAVPQSNQIISGGTDRLLRLWDLDTPSNSYTLSVSATKSAGQHQHQQPGGRYIYSKGAASIVDAEHPPPSSTAASPSTATIPLPAPHHQDAITAIGAAVVQQQQYLVSASREGVVKVWHNQ